MLKINIYILKLIYSLTINSSKTNKLNNKVFLNFKFNNVFKKKQSVVSGKVENIIEPNSFSKVFYIGNLDENSKFISNYTNVMTLYDLTINKKNITTKNLYPVCFSKNVNDLYSNNRILFKYKLIPTIKNNNLTTNLIDNINNLMKKQDYLYTISKKNRNIIIPIIHNKEFNIKLILAKINFILNSLNNQKILKSKNKNIQFVYINKKHTPSFKLFIN